MFPSRVRPNPGARTRPRVGMPSGPEANAGRAWLWALASILALTAAQLFFLTVGCDWDLCGDEAEYWAWSRRLDWSYYAKGPLIALVIRLGTELAGSASLALTGSLMPAVRLPALLLGGLTGWGVFRLTSETCRSERAGLFATLLLPAVPLFRLGGVMMTIDTPLVCCWTWAAVWSYRAIVRDQTRGWLFAGVLVALGVLAKYTMLAFPASIGVFLLTHKDHRAKLFRPGFWIMALGCAAGMAPILAWNAGHDWVAADQMSERVGLTSSWNWGRLMPLAGFLGGEVAVLGVWWLFGVLALGWAFRRILVRETSVPRDSGAKVVRQDRSVDDRAGLLYLVSLWVVVWSACVTVGLLGESEANWAAPAHVSIVALIGGWADARMARASARGRSTRRLAWVLGGLWVVSLVSLSLLQHSEWLYPSLSRVIPASRTELPAPLRQLDPTCRMRGYRELAAEVERRLEALRAEGLDPFVLTPTYTLASSLSFYLPGQPEVYCLSWSPAMAAKAVNQHDLWHPNPRHDLDHFQGRTALVVEDANMQPNYAHGITQLRLFGAAKPTSRLFVRRLGAIVAAWDLTICQNYHGPENTEETRALLKTYSSPQYYAAHGGTPEGFVTGLYGDLLGRPPGPRDVPFWAKALADQPRVNIIAKLIVSDEFRQRRRR